MSPSSPAAMRSLTSRHNGYDLDAIFQDIKEQEKKSGLKFVSYPPRQAVPNQLLQPTGAAISVSQSRRCRPRHADDQVQIFLHRLQAEALQRQRPEAHELIGP